MLRWLGLAAIISSLLLVQGCSSLRKAAGLDKRSPDEFAVVKRAPLIVPPEFDLRPPMPGASRPNVNTASEQARATLTGQAAEPPRSGTTPAGFDRAPPEAASSEGEQALLARTGSSGTAPDIRGTIGAEQPTSVPVDDALFSEIMREPAPSELAPTVIERRQTPIVDLEGNP